MTILIVEDDEDISSLLGRGLALEGYDVDFARTGPDAISRARGRDYLTIILDVILPGCSGLDVCRKLRSEGETAAIIMLSARDSVADRVEGLSSGADDYMVKPFAFEELLARIKAQSRKAAVGGEAAAGSRLKACGLTLDQKLRQIEKDGQIIELTERETELLALFMRHAGRPMSRTEIFDALWEGQGGASINVVDVYVGYLRRKLEPVGGGGKSLIRTVRGVGFMLQPEALAAR
jgi:DNA-binding response OmpR family regulator